MRARARVRRRSGQHMSSRTGVWSVRGEVRDREVELLPESLLERRCSRGVLRLGGMRGCGSVWLSFIGALYQYVYTSSVAVFPCPPEGQSPLKVPRLWHQPAAFVASHHYHSAYRVVASRLVYIVTLWSIRLFILMLKMYKLRSGIGGRRDESAGRFGNWE